jgi:hypothetical protein
MSRLSIGEGRDGMFNVRRALAVAGAFAAVSAGSAGAQSTSPPAAPPKTAAPIATLRAVTIPARGMLRVVPACAAEETGTGTISLSYVSGNRVYGTGTVSPFACAGGRLNAASLQSLPVPNSLWARARTPSGVTVYVNVRRAGAASFVRVALWLHSAARAARAANWSELGTQCFGTPVAAGGGGTYHVSVPYTATFNGLARTGYPGDWVQVYAAGQLYYPYSGGSYSGWTGTSGTLTYTARSLNGATTTSWGVVIGAPVGADRSNELMWGNPAHVGFSIPSKHYARIWVWARTASHPAWVGDWVYPVETWPASAYGVWCRTA